MSVDSIWLCPTLARETWIARKDARFGIEQYKFGTYSVKVSAGQNCLVDELYLFLNLQDARSFYEHDVQFREFVDAEGNGYGFDEISLRVKDEPVAVRHGKFITEAETEQSAAIHTSKSTTYGGFA